MAASLIIFMLMKLSCIVLLKLETECVDAKKIWMADNCLQLNPKETEGLKIGGKYLNSYHQAVHGVLRYQRSV